MRIAGDDTWWQQLGRYVEHHIGNIEFTSDTIVGDLPQILHVRPRLAPGRRVLVSQGTTLGKYPREFCIEIAADSVDDQALVDGLVTNLRMFADYARGSANEFKLGDTIAFDDPPQSLWEGSTHVGFCLTGAAVDESVGDLEIEGIGNVPLLIAAPVFADELSKFPRGQALRTALVAKGYDRDTRQTRKSVARWSLW